MDDELKARLEELGHGIDEALRNGRVPEIVDEMRRLGYNVFLVLETTIGYASREEEAEVAPPAAISKHPSSKPGEIDLTQQDKKFLRALKIKLDGKKKP